MESKNNFPPDEDEQFHGLYDAEDGHLSEDPDSTENALSGIELPDVDEIISIDAIDEIDRLDQQIAAEIGSSLGRYGWKGLEYFNEQEYLDLCSLLDIEPALESLLIAIEDVGFSIEWKNFRARTLDRVPDLTTIEEEAAAIEDISESQERWTVEAYWELGRIITDDPIMKKMELYGQRRNLTARLDQLNPRQLSRVEEYDEMMDRREQLAQVEQKITELTSNEALLNRRERAFRRMHWLVEQDFIKEAMAEHDTQYKTFHDLAELMAGRYQDVLVTKFNGENDELVAIDPAQAPMVRKWVPGLIEQLGTQLAERMAVRAGKTSNDVDNELVMLRRLMQAQAICENVFRRDLDDRVYLENSITKPEYQFLDFIKRRVFMHADDEILEEFFYLLPGSDFREHHNTDLDDVPMGRFSGRTLKEVFEDIDTIINDSIDMDREFFDNYLKALSAKELSKPQMHSLMTKACHILERLVLKEGYHVRGLIKEDLAEE